jgi:uncharacterized protein YjbI with pentapeptide repeats
VPRSGWVPPLIASLDWPRCTIGSCAGAQAHPYERCLAHLAADELDHVLAALRPGVHVDVRGVVATASLVRRLLAGARDDRGPRLGRARFDYAVFPEPVTFAGATFACDASFDHARFEGTASFSETRFVGNVSFADAEMAGNLSLYGAHLARHVSFHGTRVGGDAVFTRASFAAGACLRMLDLGGAAAFDEVAVHGDADLAGACFGGIVSFRGATVGGDLVFDRARFRAPAWLGPLRAAGEVRMSLVRAAHPLTLDATSTRAVVLHRSLFTAPATLRVGEAEIDLTGCTFAEEVRLAPARRHPPVRVASLSGVHAARLLLTDVDLSGCRFDGFRTADFVLEGICRFATLPLRGGRRERIVLAEELQWRAAPTQAAAHRLAMLYQRLSQAVPAAQAADLRYRAMDMRRHAEDVPRRRWLLTFAWATCGYGMRLGRALVWLAMLALLAISGVTAYHHVRHPSRPHGRTTHAMSAGIAESPPPRALEEARNLEKVMVLGSPSEV